MNLQQAQARTLELISKAKDDGLTAEEQTELTNCNTIMAQAQAAASMTESQVKAALKSKGIQTGSGVLSNPTVLLAAKVVGFVGCMALSAFGGMKYGERRTSRRFATGEFTHGGMGQMGQGNDSPNSHLATSPLDGRHFNHAGNPGNDGNTTNHPGPIAGRGRSAANAT